MSLTNLTLEISWPNPTPGEVFVLCFSYNNIGGRHTSCNSEERVETNYDRVVSWSKSIKKLSSLTPILHWSSCYIKFWVRSLLKFIFKNVDHVRCVHLKLVIVHFQETSKIKIDNVCSVFAITSSINIL